MKTLKPDLAELHLGILQNRMARIKQKMNVCMAKLGMEDDKIDKTGLKEEMESLDKEYKAYEQNIDKYESIVLNMTKLDDPADITE